MLDYIKNPDTWMTIIAVVISIIALFQTAKQTKLSNKQQLFDRRLEKYMLLKDLLILYKNSRGFISENENITVLVSRGALSKAVGQNRKNKLRLMERYKNLRFAEADGIPTYGVQLHFNNGEMKCI